MQNRTNNGCVRVSPEPVECVSPPLRGGGARLSILTNGESIEENQLFNNDTQTDAFN